jgi:Zn ribbon nucleic-acid-binding protein|uniref:Phosphohydrolase n=1 Tax=Desulfobacca acetoxidans TaxID=60893 RepID=A0A7V6A2U3_9BACT
MEQIKCPGQDTRYWKSDDIFTVECPKCGAEMEFFKDDTRRRCAWCGHLFYNPKIEMGCAEWCQYADKCVPELVKEKQAMQTFKERLKERALALAGGDPKLAARLNRGLALATDLLKAEGGDPKVVFAAILLQKIGPEQGKDLLAEMETEPEIAQSILEVLTAGSQVSDINGQIYQDVLALLEAEAGGAAAPLHTRTAQRLASKIQPRS